MHDIDRTSLDYGQQFPPVPHEAFETLEFGQAGGLSEQQEVQFAHELLSVNNEQELEQFLGDFIGKAISTISNVAHSPIGQAIGGVLKGVAKKALPMAGAALGGYIGGPLGAKIGSGLANAAGTAVGLEYEAQDTGEAEFEGARQFVRLAADTAHNAVAAAHAGADPREAAQSAALAAAKRLAPGLISPTAAVTPAANLGFGHTIGMPATAMASTGSAAAGPPGQTGRWIRRGKHVVLLGV
jgi:hypothetical protein